jgi:hypothetical protein
MSTLLHTAPVNQSEPTGNYTEDGKPMFRSREWRRNEKQEYIMNNLRNLFQEEVPDETEAVPH